jgi:hypothetical protein
MQPVDARDIHQAFFGGWFVRTRHRESNSTWRVLLRWKGGEQSSLDTSTELI